LVNATLWATNEPPPVVVKGPGILDIAVWCQANSMTVHLVNLTNPMMMKGPVREVIPVPAQTVRIQVPQGKRIGRVQLLVASKDIPFQQQNKIIDFEIPSIELHEVIAVDFRA
jgi:hypothetical protein